MSSYKIFLAHVCGTSQQLNHKLHNSPITLHSVQPHNNFTFQLSKHNNSKDKEIEIIPQIEVMSCGDSWYCIWGNNELLANVMVVGAGLRLLAVCDGEWLGGLAPYVVLDVVCAKIEVIGSRFSIGSGLALRLWLMVASHLHI